MKLRARSGAVLVAVAVLVGTACVQIRLDIDFNEDGSGTSRIDVRPSEAAMDYPLLDGRSIAEGCATYAEELRYQYGEALGRLTPTVLPDDTCSITSRIDFDADVWLEGNSAGSEQSGFVATDDGWQVVLRGLDQNFEGLEDAVGPFSNWAMLESVFGDFGVLVSVKLPGYPTSDHNAHWVEDGRFVWEFKGADVVDIPDELRAASSTESSTGLFGIPPAVVIAIVVAALVLAVGVAHVLAQRREEQAGRTPSGDGEPVATGAPFVQPTYPWSVGDDPPPSADADDTVSGVDGPSTQQSPTPEED